ncbi:hypothetical protein KUH32_03615 [Thalassococcus sp. CAU 1522]|uniref:Uncharacterized protein n=1 Tax=Thalassococcus arenae TaxID=2851652 RepID=A0ABS6N4A9_9RHOB|nr:hypothetical protein [Thalassococcus arenae]MBV2358851.1 hypothetical protein [Thalassococcus arenae]
MTHWPLSWQHVRYRTWLLRRLTLVCAALLFAGVWIGQTWAGDPDAGLLWPAVLCLLLPALHNVLFPGGWVDALAFSASGALCAALWPMGLAEVSLLGTVAVFFVGAVAGTFLIGLLHGLIPLGRRITRRDEILDVSADRAAAAFLVFPDQDGPGGVTGPRDARGLIPVWMHTVFPDCDNGFALPDPADRRDGPADYHVCILDQGPLWQVQQVFLPIGRFTTASMARSVTVSRVEIEPLPDGRCRYLLLEESDVFDLVTAVSWWLTDFHTDYMRARVDGAADRPTPAVSILPQVTLQTLLARALSVGQDAPQV